MADNNEESRIDVDNFDFAREGANDDTPMLVNYHITRLQQAMANLALQGEVQQQLHAYGIIPTHQEERASEKSLEETFKRALSMAREGENPYQELWNLLFEDSQPSRRRGHAPHEESPSKEKERNKSPDGSMEDVASRRRQAQRSPTPAKRKRSPHNYPHLKSKREEKKLKKKKERKRSPSSPSSSPTSSSRKKVVNTSQEVFLLIIVMSKQSHVPKFGQWDPNDQMPFTLVFEKARADHKGGTGAVNKVVNPNDPYKKLAAFGLKSNGAPPSSQRTSQQYYAGESEQRVDTAVVPNISGGPMRSTMGEPAKKGSYGGMHDNQRMGQYREQSSKNPSSPSKGRLSNRPVVPSHLAPDRKGQREGGSPLHHAAKTRLRPASRGEDMVPERASAIPKFGAWDEKDPTSGDGYTLIFSHARKEKIIVGPGGIPAHQSDSPVKADFDYAYKAPHQSLRQKVAQ
ncbi:hypothetical protein L7F22_025822 [Adiantum nelumboides]|nr:hypothetical protein [Adiantum nelumboides]